MRWRAIAIVAVVLAAGVSAFYLMRNHRMPQREGVLLDTMPELTWVRSELKLTDGQFQKIQESHAAYRPMCGEMCHRISQSHQRLAALAQAARGVTPELDAALREHARLHVLSQQAMLGHIYGTAALMDPAQAAKYLEIVIPYALDIPDHQDPNVHGSPP